MSTYVLMRILESAPHRYDFGIRLLTLGALDRTYDRLAGNIEPEQRVLDLGCGTGALTLRAARRGAWVKGVDINAQMLAIAGQRVRDAGLSERVELAETGVAELDQEQAQSYQVVTSGLCLSELSEDELGYTLKEVARILSPGGLLLVADEITPRGCGRRLIHGLIRAPLVALAYLITQQTTHPASHLAEKMAAAGLTVTSMRRNRLGSFGEFIAQKPPARPS